MRHYLQKWNQQQTAAVIKNDSSQIHLNSHQKDYSRAPRRFMMLFWLSCGSDCICLDFALAPCLFHAVCVRLFSVFVLFLALNFLFICSEGDREGHDIPRCGIENASGPDRIQENNHILNECSYSRGLKRDVVYLCWPIAPSSTSLNAGGVGELRGLSQWVQLCT